MAESDEKAKNKGKGRGRGQSNDEGAGNARPGIKPPYPPPAHPSITNNPITSLSNQPSFSGSGENDPSINRIQTRSSQSKQTGNSSVPQRQTSGSHQNQQSGDTLNPSETVDNRPRQPSNNLSENTQPLENPSRENPSGGMRADPNIFGPPGSIRHVSEGESE